MYDSNRILQFCLAIRKPYSFTFTYCFVCKLKLEIVNLNYLPLLNVLPLLLLKFICTTQPLRTLLVAATKQENANAKIQNASSCSYTSTNMLSS